jgi:hypothetical protein
MTELWLKFRDEKGEDRRVLVEGEKFTIGRHSDNDLCIPNAKLSRQHVKIDRFADVYIISDSGSSNGTTLNGDNLTDPVALKDGDWLDLGGGLQIEVEVFSDNPRAKKSGVGAAAANDEDWEEEESPGSSAANSRSINQGAAANGSAIPTSVFIIAPLFGIIILFCVGGIFLVTSGDDTDIVNGNNGGFIYSPTPDETSDETPATPTPSPAPTAGNSGNGATPTPTPLDANVQPTPEVSSEAKKIEENSAAFLRRIALSDPNAFLASSQVQIVGGKIGQFKGSSALAENLRAVRQNASQFESMAQSQGLKAQFLATAALAKIGNSRGDPLSVAKTMLPVLGELRISLANNLADDNLLIIAAYEQGVAGKNLALRNTLEALSKRNPNVSPREIRTIWFLKKQAKITDSEYDFALRFLAIGTITQNPKDFNVNAEAVIFN